MIRRNKKLTNIAKSMRKEMTPHERKLWFLFLRNYPIKIYKQRIIDSYVVDFYCDRAKLVIEVDGSQHFEPDEHKNDCIRTENLSKYGLLVLRYSNREIDRQFREVCEQIHRVIMERVGFDPYERMQEKNTKQTNLR